MYAKHDLSHGIAKLDYPSLLKTATAAVRYSGQMVDHYREEARARPSTTGHQASAAASLAEAADFYASAMETYHVLKEMETRWIISVINCPCKDEAEGLAAIRAADAKERKARGEML